LDPPEAKIYSRLGFKKKTTQISNAQLQQTRQHILQAASLIALRGSFSRLPLRDNNGLTVRLDDRLTFESEKLASFLRNCHEAVLMGSTAGGAIMDAIREKTGAGDLAAAVVYDATASEMADAALDWMMDYINRQLRREGKTLRPRRFSAGYADFALANQIQICREIQMDRIGVTLTSSFILLPEKSVTAVCGIPG
ncbi:MAG: hypothetical protein R6W75_01215, partial [Smithellaceae bacterium]